MTNAIRLLILAGAVFVAPALVGTYASTAPPATQAKPAIVLTDAEKQAVKGFEARLKDYAALHQKLEATLQTLPDQATPEQIDEHQEDMAALIKKARKGAKQGEFFTPGMQALVKRALGATLDGAGGKFTKKSIMDDNPGLPNVSVNDRYPDGVPVSSMPIELLETLPKLGEKMEYRFLGKRLVLVDVCAQLILDITPNVLP